MLIVGAEAKRGCPKSNAGDIGDDIGLVGGKEENGVSVSGPGLGLVSTCNGARLGFGNSTVLDDGGDSSVDRATGKL